MLASISSPIWDRRKRTEQGVGQTMLRGRTPSVEPANGRLVTLMATDDSFHVGHDGAR